MQKKKTVKFITIEIQRQPKRSKDKKSFALKRKREEQIKMKARKIEQISKMKIKANKIGQVQRNKNFKNKSEQIRRKRINFVPMSSPKELKKTENNFMKKDIEKL